MSKDAQLPTRTSVRRSTVAPGSAAGYLFQLERALDWLSRSGPDDWVGVETTEDVVHETAEGGLTREQDKHSIDPAHVPFGDWSRDLWKSLAIWAEAARNAELTHVDVQLHLVTNQVVPAGLARRISEATNAQSIAAVLSELRENSHFAPKGIRTYVERVIATSDEDLARVVGSIRLFDSSNGTAGTPLKEGVAARLHLPDYVDQEVVLQQLLGWVQDVCIRAWRDHRPAWLSGRAFNNQVQRVISLMRTRALLRSVGQITVTSEDTAALTDRTFVHQIRLLELEGDDDELQAMADFFRADVEQTRLVEEGELTRDEWDDFEAQMIDRWQRLRNNRKRGLLPADPDYAQRARQIGSEILSATLSECTIKLGDAAVHEYFLCGHYHSLADGTIVGWHPDYKALLERTGQP